MRKSLCRRTTGAPSTFIGWFLDSLKLRGILFESVKTNRRHYDSIHFVKHNRKERILCTIMSNCS